MMNATVRAPGDAPRKSRIRGGLRRVESHLQRKTVSGLLALLPLLVTFIVIWFIVRHADGLVESLPWVAAQSWVFPGIGLVSIIVICYIAGLLTSTRPGQRVMAWKSFVLNHIPIVRSIFGATEQATAVIAGADFAFSRVVFLEWPREGMAAIGFVTGHAYSQNGDISLAIVYIPTVPNPTSGNLAFVNQDDLFETDMTVENAIKLVFSGGIVLPPTMALARMPRVSAEHEFIGRFNNYSESSSE